MSRTLPLICLCLLAIFLLGLQNAPRIKLLHTFETDGRFHGLAFSPDGSLLAAGTWDGTITVWDTATQEELASFQAHDGIVASLDFSEEGATLLLKVPSVLIPSEHTYLINPNHERFSEVKVAEPVPLPFEARILKVVGS